MDGRFDLQGHRGARGLKPENTLPGFEVALDIGVTSIETDLHLSRDGVPILIHDSCLSEVLYCVRPAASVPAVANCPPVRSLDLEQLRGYRADRNPDPRRFPAQDAGVTPLAKLFAEERGYDLYAPPTLADLFAFTAAYAGDLGARARKTLAQRERARSVRFDLELKRVPYRPETIGDGFNGSGPALLENRVVEAVRAAAVLERTSVRSFDHRCVLAVKSVAPGLQTAVIVDGTAPVAPAELARRANAATYCPNADFLDKEQVRRLHAEAVRVVPWTVNDPDGWNRVIDWGVDGIATDFPDRLAELLTRRGIVF